MIRLPRATLDTMCIHSTPSASLTLSQTRPHTHRRTEGEIASVFTTFTNSNVHFPAPPTICLIIPEEFSVSAELDGCTESWAGLLKLKAVWMRIHREREQINLQDEDRWGKWRKWQWYWFLPVCHFSLNLFMSQFEERDKSTLSMLFKMWHRSG